MNLSQANDLANQIMLISNKKAYVDPSFKHRKFTGVAVVTGADEFTVGFCAGTLGMSWHDAPMFQKSSPMGTHYYG